MLVAVQSAHAAWPPRGSTCRPVRRAHHAAACTHRNGSPGCSFSAFVTTLLVCAALSARLQKCSHADHSARSPLNLRVARSKMKWMRRTMPKSARLRLPAIARSLRRARRSCSSFHSYSWYLQSHFHEDGNDVDLNLQCFSAAGAGTLRARPHRRRAARSARARASCCACAGAAGGGCCDQA